MYIYICMYVCMYMFIFIHTRFCVFTDMYRASAITESMKSKLNRRSHSLEPFGLGLGPRVSGFYRGLGSRGYRGLGFRGLGVRGLGPGILNLRNPPPQPSLGLGFGSSWTRVSRHLEVC